MRLIIEMITKEFGGLFIVKQWKFLIMTIMAIVFAALGTASLTEEVSAKINPITVTINEFQPVELQNPPLLQNGSLYLPLRETGTLMNSKTTWFSEGKRIIVNSPVTRIEMKLGSKQATVNGKPYTLAAMPKNEKGVVYVPVRFVTEALGAQVEWITKERRVNLKFKELYVFAEKGVKGYWLNKQNGELYVSTNEKEAKLVANTDAEIKEYGSISIDSMSSNVDLLMIHDLYGEPHIHNKIFKMVLVDEKLKLESKVYYFGHHAIQNVDWTKSNHALLMHGAALYEVDETGAALVTHDLQALTGYKDTSFQVELYDEQYMVIRPHDTGWLTLIDRQTNKATRLADVLLNEEKLDIYSTMDPKDIEFIQWDGLKVKKRVGNTLELTHHWFMDGSSTELTYTLSSTE